MWVRGRQWATVSLKDREKRTMPPSVQGRLGVILILYWLAMPYPLVHASGKILDVLESVLFEK